MNGFGSSKGFRKDDEGRIFDRWSDGLFGKE